MTRSGQRSRSLFAERPLKADFVLSCAGILAGILGGLLYGVLFRRWDGFYALVTLIAGPLLVLALLWLLTGPRARSGMRFVGASTGWFVFLWFFGMPHLGQWLLSFYHIGGPILVLFAASFLATFFVASGLVAFDKVSLKVFKKTIIEPPPSET